jgi:hypothetical protein
MEEEVPEFSSPAQVVCLRNSVNTEFCQHEIPSTRNSVKMEFRQHGILSTRNSVNTEFRRHEIPHLF